MSGIGIGIHSPSFSNCEDMIRNTIRDMIDEMTDYKDVYVPLTTISIDKWTDEWDTLFKNN